MIATPKSLISLPVSDSEASPGQVAFAITGRTYLSYSQVTMYQACPLKFHFTYVEKAQPESVSGAMLLGSGIHAAIQRHMEALLAADALPTLDHLMEAYREKWQLEVRDLPVLYSKGEDEQTLAATASNILQTFLAGPHAKPEGEIIGIEEELRIKLSDDLPDLLSRVDLIVKRGNELVITDFKTARSMWSPETAEESAEQLVLYGHAAGPIAQELGTSVKLEFVVLSKAKTPRIESFAVRHNPDRIERSKKVIRQVFGAMQSGNIYPSPSPMNCSTCPYGVRCVKWSQ